MDKTLPTLLIRKDTKQAFSQARQMPMQDTLESLTKWVDVLNEDLGWKKYGVQA